MSGGDVVQGTGMVVCNGSVVVACCMGPVAVADVQPTQVVSLSACPLKERPNQRLVSTYLPLAVTLSGLLSKASEKNPRSSIGQEHKPHDDRNPLESRSNALYTCFYVLKNLMIMLYPFVPTR